MATDTYIEGFHYFKRGYMIEDVISKSGTISDVGCKRELANFYFDSGVAKAAAQRKRVLGSPEGTRQAFNQCQFAAVAGALGLGASQASEINKCLQCQTNFYINRREEWETFRSRGTLGPEREEWD